MKFAIGWTPKRRIQDLLGPSKSALAGILLIAGLSACSFPMSLGGALSSMGQGDEQGQTRANANVPTVDLTQPASQPRLAAAPQTTEASLASAPAQAPAPGPLGVTSARPYQGGVLQNQATYYNALGNGRQTVAVLLPLSGELARFGQQMQNALDMARLDMGGRVQFQVFDTSSTPEGAQFAAQQAVSRGAGIIFGPLRGASVPGVIQLAQTASIPVVSFSNDMAQVQNGGVVAGLVPADSASKILAFAGQRGLTRVGIVAPANTYGYASADAAQQAAASAGVGIARVWFYEAGRDATDRTRVAREIGEAAEFMDALLIPESGPRLKEISSLIAYQVSRSTESKNEELEEAGVQTLEAPKLQILGVDIWDDAKLSDERTLVGAWYATPSSQRLQDFRQRYRRQFGGDTSNQAALAYEAGEIALQILARGGNFTSSALMGAQFETIFGTTSFQNGQIAVRSMAVKQVGRSANSIVAVTAPNVYVPSQLSSSYGRVAASNQFQFGQQGTQVSTGGAPAQTPQGQGGFEPYVVGRVGAL